MFPGVIAHPRVVPREGAVISGTFIPGGVCFSFFFSIDTLSPLLVRIFSPLPLPISMEIFSWFSHSRCYHVHLDGRGPEFLLRAQVVPHVRAPGGISARAVVGRIHQSM